MGVKKYIGHILLLVTAAIWGFGFVAQDAIEGLGAFTVGAVRNWIAFIFLIFVIIIFDKLRGGARQLISRRGIGLTRVEIIGGILCGLALLVASFFQQTGIQMGTDGGKAAFITSLYVVLVPIYSLFIKKKPPVNVWVAVAIAAVGFYLLCIKDDLSISPTDIYVVICAFIFPFHILLIDKFDDVCDPFRLSMMQFLTSAVLQTVLCLIFEPTPIETVVANVWPLVFLGIGSSGIAYTLQMVGQKGVNPSVASIIMSLESLFGVIGTALVLGTVLSLREYIGCAVLLIAVILAQIDIPALIKKIKNKRGVDESPAK